MADRDALCNHGYYSGSQKGAGGPLFLMARLRTSKAANKPE